MYRSVVAPPLNGPRIATHPEAFDFARRADLVALALKQGHTLPCQERCGPVVHSRKTVTARCLGCGRVFGERLTKCRTCGAAMSAPTIPRDLDRRDTLGQAPLDRLAQLHTRRRVRRYSRISPGTHPNSTRRGEHVASRQKGYQCPCVVAVPQRSFRVGIPACVIDNRPRPAALSALAPPRVRGLPVSNICAVEGREAGEGCGGTENARYADREMALMFPILFGSPANRSSG
jgi:hypothetical protein